jgi:subtilisin family serine protease
MRNRWGKKISPALSVGAAAGLWLGALLLYLFAGIPGLYGDRLFIILKEQADVSQAAAMPDYDARRQFVYHTLTQHAEQSQAGLRQAFERFGVDYTPYYLVNAIEADNSLATRLILLTRSEVDRAIPSPVMRPLSEPLKVSSGDAPAPSAPQWNLTNIGADRVWNELGVRGKGIVIGQSDSGVQGDHPELQNSYRGRNSGDDYNWLDPWTHTASPVDFGGHGTHTTGSILGESVGVAPDAEWMACVNLQRNLGNPALYLDCMQFMLAPYPQNGSSFSDGDPLRAAHILNNSWGCPEEMEGCDPTALLPAAWALRVAGIFVVVSAGNDGPACSTVSDPPAIYDDVFTVGAVDKRNDLASFSSVGPVTVDGSRRTKPDILAPGVDVLSSYPNNTYSEASGTSMAGPHLVGVVALMWSANPALIGDIGRTEQLLIQTAAPFTGSIADDPIFSDDTASPEERRATNHRRL